MIFCHLQLGKGLEIESGQRNCNRFFMDEPVKSSRSSRVDSGKPSKQHCYVLKATAR